MEIQERESTVTQEKGTQKKHYGAIDGLRTIACLGIVLMHMASNNDYKIGGFFYKNMIPSFTNFVFLFMAVSAFGMCCGYYERIIYNKISVTEFYGKRFQKVFPFFAVLVLLDVIMSPSVNALYEAFADLTLLFGFLPGAGNIEVIGVGWFVGLIFVFYLIFPFFCFLLEDRKRAWISFGIGIAYNITCVNYFETDRRNILYCGCFFLAGGLVYLYKDEIENLVDRVNGARWILLAMVVVSIVLYYLLAPLLNDAAMSCLLVSAVLLIYAVSDRGGYRRTLLNNGFVRFFSSISMEVYLSHMVIFRLGGKLHLNTVFGNGWLQYIVTVLYVVVGAVVFALALQKIISVAKRKLP